MNRLLIKNGKALATRALLTNSQMPVIQQQMRMMRTMNASMMMQNSSLLFKNNSIRMFSENAEEEGEVREERPVVDIYEFANKG